MCPSYFTTHFPTLRRRSNRWWIGHCRTWAMASDHSMGNLYNEPFLLMLTYQFPKSAATHRKSRLLLPLFVYAYQRIDLDGISLDNISSLPFLQSIVHQKFGLPFFHPFEVPNLSWRLSIKHCDRKNLLMRVATFNKSWSSSAWNKEKNIEEKPFFCWLWMLGWVPIVGLSFS